MDKASDHRPFKETEKHELKLRTILSISFALLGILAAGLMLFVMFIIVKNQIRQEISHSIRDIVAVGALQINGDIHAGLKEPEQERSPDYASLQKVLQRIQSAGTDLLYVYTMRYEGGKLVFVVDATTGNNHSFLGDIYEDATPEFIKNLAQINEPMVDQAFTTDRWGVTLSGYAPIYTSVGKVDGFLGIDLDASTVLARERRVFMIGLGIFTALIPIQFLFGWILGSILSRPVSSLVQGVSRISEGELDTRIKVSSRTEIGKLASAFNKLAEGLKQLLQENEEKAAVFTSTLEKHAHNLESAAKVQQVLSTTLDPKQMADEVVEKFAELFNLYFVGFYRFFKDQNTLRLFSASGEVGKALLERGSEFQMGEGLIGWAAAYGKPRIALEVERDPLWGGIEELPEVKSAIAYPLRSRGQILGVLCLYSQKLDEFEEDNLAVFQNLADQIGMGLDNALLFASSQVALEDSQRAFSLMSRSAWDEMIQGHIASGYRSSEIGLEEIYVTSDQEAALDRKYLKLPVIVRGQVLATINAAKPDQAGWWSDEEIGLMRTLAEQLGVALENARLFSNTQRSAERERILSDISSKVRASTNLEVILQTAVRDLADVLKVNKGSIQLRTKDDRSSSWRSDA